MNTGAISNRYAKAMLSLVTEHGTGEKVCGEALTMLDSAVPLPGKLSPEMTSLLALLKKNGRLEYLKFVLSGFVGLYFRQQKITYVKLYSVHPDKALEDRVRNMLSGVVTGNVRIESFTDESLIGGFVLKFDGKKLDASVRHQFDLLRSEFNTENNRII